MINSVLLTWTTGAMDGWSQSGTWRAQRTSASRLGVLTGIRVKSPSPRRGHRDMGPIRKKCPGAVNEIKWDNYNPYPPVDQSAVKHRCRIRSSSDPRRDRSLRGSRCRVSPSHRSPARKLARLVRSRPGLGGCGERFVSATQTEFFVDRVHAKAGSYIIVRKPGCWRVNREAAASGRAAVGTVMRYCDAL